MRDRISGTIGFVPRCEEAAGWVGSGKLTTPIPLIPRPVLDHVIGAACRYVEVYSHDVFAARRYLGDLAEEWERIFQQTRPPWGSPAYSKFDAWIRRRFGWANPKARSAMGVVAPWNRSEERSDGTGWVSTCRSRWWPYH